MSGDPDLKQIVTRTFEGGVRGAAAGPGGSLITYNADYYYSVTNDDIEFLQSPFNPVGEGYFSNVGNVRRTGFDVGATLTSARWKFYAAYSLTDATYQSSYIEQSNNPEADANGNITVQPGDHVPGIPENIFKFGASYQATPRWQVGISATAQTGSYLYGDEANLTPQLPGYFVADFTTQYAITPKLSVFGTVDNITDSKYYNYGTFSPTGADGGVYVAQAPNYSNPRSYSLAAPIGGFAGVRLKF
jgi:outer membrane receptor protein involved in Fe transport